MNLHRVDSNLQRVEADLTREQIRAAIDALWTLPQPRGGILHPDAAGALRAEAQWILTHLEAQCDALGRAYLLPRHLPMVALTLTRTEWTILLTAYTGLALAQHGFPYTEGAPITFRGYRVVIVD